MGMRTSSSKNTTFFDHEFLGHCPLPGASQRWLCHHVGKPIPRVWLLLVGRWFVFTLSRMANHHLSPPFMEEYEFCDFLFSKHLKQANLRYVMTCPFLFDAVYPFTENRPMVSQGPVGLPMVDGSCLVMRMESCGQGVQRWFPDYPLANEHGNGKWTILKMYSMYSLLINGDVPASHVSLPEGRCAGCFGGMWHGWIEIESGWFRNLVMTTWDR